MAEIMIPSRGCVYMPNSTRGGSGFYALKPALKGPKDSPILIESIEPTTSDIVYPVVALDDKKYLFVMGNNFGNITISGLALLGKASLNGRAFRIVKDYFDQYRASANGGGGAPITASLPGDVAVKFYLTGMAVGKPDPQFHLQYFVFSGVVAEQKQS